MFRFRISLLNIYFWNIIAIVFFCIKFLPEFAEITLLNRIFISAAAVVIFLITTQINFIRHIICIFVSFLWSILIAQTFEYYFNIGDSAKITIYIFITIVFYIWHLLFMENPFNIVSKVAVEPPTEFSSNVKYVPDYIPFTDDKNSGSYITQYFKDKNIAINNICGEFENELSKSNDEKSSVIIDEYNKLMQNFNTQINKIITDYNSKKLTNDTAKIQIDETCGGVLIKLKSLINALKE